MAALTELSAVELVLQYRRRALSPVEVTRAVLQQVERLNPKINALCELAPVEAVRKAVQSEERWRRGEPCGELDGVPVSVKDMIATRGMPTRFGSKTLPPDHLVEVDAPSVVALRSAGAIIFGKTTTSEFGNKIVTDSPLTGISRNPWSLRKSCGGSSGGAGAALAAGMGPLALASDGGGSIRVPACWNGVFGLKPSYKRVPTADAENFGDLSNVGPMARTVRDAALMLSVAAQPWPGDWQVHPYEEHDYLANLDRGIAGLRVAYSPDLGMAKVDPGIAACVAAAVGKLSELGARVEQVDEVPPLRGYMDKRIHSLHWIARAEYTVRHTPAELRSSMDPDLLAVAKLGEDLPASVLVDAMMARLELTRGMHRFLSDYDLLVTPAFHRPPPDVPGLPSDMQTAPPLTSWCNQTLQPAASIPCGFTPDGLPAGLQIVAARYRDDLVLRACFAYEAARGPFPLAPIARQSIEEA